MGGLISSIFGGSSKKAENQSTQESGNYNRDLLTNAFSPALGYTAQGGGQLADLLGLNGQDAGAQAGARADFRNTPGYQFAMDEGSRAITGSQAAKGLLNSGSTLKSLNKFGQGMADQTYQSYIQNLLGLGGLGTQAGQIVGNAGQYSKGQSTGSESGSSSSGGLGKALGFGLSLLGSDERLKTDIELVGEHDGMNVYTFRYIGEPTVYKGLMAQEVREKYPEAVIPVGGFLGVDYSKVPNSEDIQYA